MNHYSCLTVIWYSYNNRKQSFSIFILHHFSSFFLSLRAAKLRIQTGVTAETETVMTTAMDQTAAPIETASGTQTAEAGATVAAGAWDP